ncbi:MAG: hypothetical protein GXP63_05910 [DPANN group archaeon]|nr:hypothetical protein [DPANN group archaeon]
MKNTKRKGEHRKKQKAVRKAAGKKGRPSSSLSSSSSSSDRHHRSHGSHHSHALVVSSLLILLVVVGFLVYFIAFDEQMEQVEEGLEPAETAPIARSAKLDLYVTSRCPYGTLAENALKPVIEQFGDSVSLKIHYIVNRQGSGFVSLHGPEEVQGDIVQLCAQEHAPASFLDLVVCMNKDVSSIPSNWGSCASAVGMDPSQIAAIKTCYAGEEGQQLLEASVEDSARRNVHGSPTLFINNITYSGRRDAASYLRGICARLGDHPACANTPACNSDRDCTAEPDRVGICEDASSDVARCVYADPVDFEVIVINDKDCRSCDTSRVILTDEKLFRGVHHRTIDISTPEAQAYVKKLHLTLLPVFLFSQDVTKTYTWIKNPPIRGAFQPADLTHFRMKDVMTRARYPISEQARASYLQKIGIRTGDNRPRVDFFSMGTCPYVAEAEEALLPVVDLLGDSIDVVPHYLFFDGLTPSGKTACLDADRHFCSPLGLVELQQDVRSLCVFNHAGIDAWFNFSASLSSCRDDADSCWKDAAARAGVDPGIIRSCYDQERQALLDDERPLLDAMHVLAAPSLFVDGEEYVGPSSPESFKRFICSFFETPPPSCDEQLSSGVSLSRQDSPISPTCGF